MAYARGNPKTKKQLKEWVADGRPVRVFQPGGMFADPSPNGVVYIEGPHYPKPHRWYAQGTLKDGVLVKVK